MSNPLIAAQYIIFNKDYLYSKIKIEGNITAANKSLLSVFDPCLT